MFGLTERTAAGFSIRNTLLGVAGLTLTLLLIWLLHDDLLLVFLAVLLAVSLRGAADWLAQRLRIAPRWAMAVIVLLAVAAFIGFWWWVGPQLVEQGYALGKALAQEGMDLTARYGHTGWGRSLLQKLNSAGTQAAQSLA
ncbi:MAG TPA: AI-2E family transporter, partial [Acidisoma sp.]|nr:AI-2E family transporter [Acidisoma sp.]